MKKLLLTAIALVGLMLSANAQNKKGHEKSIEVGVAVGVGEDKNNTYTLSMVNGYRFNEHFYLGLGVGIGYSNAIGLVKSDDYRILGVGFNITDKIRTETIPVPIFLSTKLNFANSSVSPFIRLDLGYTIDAKQYLRDAPGFMLEPSFGLDFAISGKSSLYALVGFNMQNQKIGILKNVQSNYNWEIGAKNKMLSAVSLRLGVRF